MKPIQVFFCPEQNAQNPDAYSPSAGKPAQVIKHWSDLGLPFNLQRFAPVTPETIAMVHDPAVVKAVLAGEASNGFGNRDLEVARSLPYTTGSMVAAALYALKTGTVAVSPTSGFHHAGYRGPSAFCTFNGLMVATQVLRMNGAEKVGILDCDAHYGNGTDEIIERLSLKDSVRHWTFGQKNITKERSVRWLELFPEIVAKFQDCDVLLYQAGADPHVDDPLGGSLTSEQMRLRDRIVFTVCKELNIPVAWNLAGGYQKPLSKVLDLHGATMQECVSAYLTISNTSGRQEHEQRR